MPGAVCGAVDSLNGSQPAMSTDPEFNTPPVRNAVVVVIDTLRPDHLGCYGYPRNTSPCIDAFSRECTVFDQAIAPAIPTMPSFTTLLTGLHPYRHGIVSHIPPKARLSETIRCFPELAKSAGMTTVGIDNLVVQGMGRGGWFSRGFDFYSGYLYQPFIAQSEELVDRAIAFVDDLADRRFLLFLHLWDPHTPYGPPAPYNSLHYAPGSAPHNLADVKKIAPEYYEQFLAEMRLQHPDDYADVVAQYDGEITRVDDQVGRLIGHLRNAGRLDDTAVVLMSDHGECFGEGGIHFDHHGLVDANVRVAMMVRTPNSKPGRIPEMVSTEDVLPTLARQCGWRLPEAEPITGHDLTPALHGNPPEPREFIVCVESTRQASLALRTAEWKLILPIAADIHGNRMPDLHGHDRTPAPQLFHLPTDPSEANDVAGQHPDILAKFTEQLAHWRASEVQRRGGHDPVLENGLSLGYDEFMARMFRRKK
jgi:arylsulfatase A-like enzyme